MSSALNALTIDDYLQFLAPELWNDDCWESVPAWPGDVFAVAASLLSRSGAYSGIGVSYWTESADSWENTAHDIACRWRRRLARVIAAGLQDTLSRTKDEGGVEARPLTSKSRGEVVRKGWSELDQGKLIRTVPNEVKGWWTVLCDFPEQAFASLEHQKSLCEALLKMCAVCDEVFEGVGVKSYRRIVESGDWDNTSEQWFWFVCWSLLFPEAESEAADESQATSLCMLIDPTRVQVMPKAQTPHFGLSVRSLTHYISLCPSVPVKSTWVWQSSMVRRVHDHYCNILLLPWPFEVSPKNFSRSECDNKRYPNIGWFEYEPSACAALNLISQYLDDAIREVGSIEVMVLPEAALTYEQFLLIRKIAIERGVTLICGVTKQVADATSKKKMATKENGAYVVMTIDEAAREDTEGEMGPWEYSQLKHHRWKLDRSQIVRYGLSASLDPEKEWWESIPIDKRKLNVFPFRNWLCVCPMICEDLARMDPAGQLVRALAPDLVIALLFDGPQLTTRWSAFYATVLAEDPGSSVLTLTSLGMARLSRPVDIDASLHSSVIALWRDARGKAVEIRLPEGKQAAVLTVLRQDVTATTADGRKKNINGLAPVFGGLSFL